MPTLLRRESMDENPFANLTATLQRQESIDENIFAGLTKTFQRQESIDGVIMLTPVLSRTETIDEDPNPQVKGLKSGFSSKLWLLY